MINITCDNCGDTFTRTCRKKNQKNIFCSKRCQNSFGRVSFTCKYCNKKCVKNKSDPKIYCSQSCSATSNNLKRSSEKKYFCVWCNSFISDRWIPPKSLCNECKNKRGKNSIYDNMSLEEFKTKYGRLASYHSVLRQHSRRIFKLSNKNKVCQICNYDKFVHICHIKDVKDFEKTALISEINNINNLIALCPNHHWEFDHGILKI